MRFSRNTIEGMKYYVYGLRYPKTKKYFYIGKTLSNIKQRLSSHIQKLTCTNNNKNTTPKKWQKISFKRYKLLGKESVNLNDLFINFYHRDGDSTISLEQFENLIYKLAHK